MNSPSFVARCLHAVLAATCVLLATACAARNVNFSVDAAQAAADRVINEVWGSQPQSVPSPNTQAAGEAALNLSSREFQRLVDSMEARFPELSPYYGSGALGLGADGYVMVRDNNRVPQPERNRLRTLVANENADRTTLYRELARSSGQPEWERPIRAAFARRWIQRARAGWYVQDGSAWVKQ